MTMSNEKLADAFLKSINAPTETDKLNANRIRKAEVNVQEAINAGRRVPGISESCSRKITSIASSNGINRVEPGSQYRYQISRSKPTKKPKRKLFPDDANDPLLEEREYPKFEGDDDNEWADHIDPSVLEDQAKVSGL